MSVIKCILAAMFLPIFPSFGDSMALIARALSDAPPVEEAAAAQEEPPAKDEQPPVPTRQDLKKEAQDLIDRRWGLIGQMAPEVDGDYALHRAAKKLSDLKGKIVVLDFWAVWCAPCKAAFPGLMELQEKYGSNGVQVVGITTYFEKYGFDAENGRLQTGRNLTKHEERKMVKEFAAHFKLDYQLVMVAKSAWQKVAQDYKVHGLPTVVVIDREGVVRLVRLGYGSANADAVEEMVRRLVRE